MNVKLSDVPTEWRGMCLTGEQDVRDVDVRIHAEIMLVLKEPSVPLKFTAVLMALLMGPYSVPFVDEVCSEKNSILYPKL